MIASILATIDGTDPAAIERLLSSIGRALRER
jgi:hypothetical protein